MAKKKASKKIKKKKSSLKKIILKKVIKEKKILKPVKRTKVKLKKKLNKKPVLKVKKIYRSTKFKKKTSSGLKTKDMAGSIDPTVHKTKIRVIGIGGGGSTIVSEITSRIKKADFYVANTDAQALKESSKIAKKFQFGQNLTHGLGTGMNVELGETAALEEKEKIEKILEGQDLCIIISCLGGGTSSGAAPVFSSISKKLGNLTYGIFTLPFEFEGKKKMEAALESLEKIKPYLNVYTIVPNERIFQYVDKNTPLRGALSAINQRLADNLGGLIEMIYLPGLINIDFADLSTILFGRGRLTYLNTIRIEEIDKEEIEKKLISSPLYPYTIKGAKGILYNISSGKNIQLAEVSRISNIISESVNKQAKIIFGINQNQKDDSRIKITLLATGCSAKGLEFETFKKPRKKILKPVKKESLDNISKPKETKKEVSKPVENKKPKKKVVNKKQENKVSIEEKKSENVFVEVRPEVSKVFKPEIVDETKVRKNALQVKKEAEQVEKDLLEQENIWDVPAILRKKDN